MSTPEPSAANVAAPASLAWMEIASRLVSESLDSLYPRDPSRSQMVAMTTAGCFDEFLDGVETSRFKAAIVDPVRDIIDRGGKCWRPYLSLLACQAVGGDGIELLPWLGVLELLHVGSLIVDDVEDDSPRRRGGPACHVEHGRATAINAGTSAYFAIDRMLTGLHLPAEDEVRIYRAFFSAMRASHAGQGLDIDGRPSSYGEAVASGNSGALESEVVAVHRLKTALPGALFAKIGAIVGGGSEAQIEALVRYVDAVGVAFQIGDDVLDLGGFQGSRKRRGDDLREGKVSFPIARAFSLLPAEGRKRLQRLLERARRGDQVAVESAIEALFESGAVQSAIEHAERLVDQGIKQLAAHIDDGPALQALRSFGHALVSRHY